MNIKYCFPTNVWVFASLILFLCVIVFLGTLWKAFDSRLGQFARGEVVLVTETNLVAKPAGQTVKSE